MSSADDESCSGQFYDALEGDTEQEDADYSCDGYEDNTWASLESRAEDVHSCDTHKDTTASERNFHEHFKIGAMEERDDNPSSTKGGKEMTEDANGESNKSRHVDFEHEHRLEKSSSGAVSDCTETGNGHSSVSADIPHTDKGISEITGIATTDDTMPFSSPSIADGMAVEAIQELTSTDLECFKSSVKGNERSRGSSFDILFPTFLTSPGSQQDQGRRRLSLPLPLRLSLEDVLPSDDFAKPLIQSSLSDTVLLDRLTSPWGLFTSESSIHDIVENQTSCLHSTKPLSPRTNTQWRRYASLPSSTFRLLRSTSSPASSASAASSSSNSLSVSPKHLFKRSYAFLAKDPSAHVKYRVVDQNRGATYDIQDLNNQGSGVNTNGVAYSYALFPSRRDLLSHHQSSMTNLIDSGKTALMGENDEVNTSGESDSAMSLYTAKEAECQFEAAKKLRIKTKEEGSNHDLGNGSIQAFRQDSSIDVEKDLKSKSPTGNGQKKRQNFFKRIGFGMKRSISKKEASLDSPSSSPRKASVPFVASTLSVSAPLPAGKITKKKRRPATKAATALSLLPKNLVPVRCVRKPAISADFGAMLLISTFTKAHTGSIWCMSFSCDGKYFATGGEDGVILVWEVAPQKVFSSACVGNDASIGFGDNALDDELWLGKVAAARSHDDPDNEAYIRPAPPPTMGNGTGPVLGTDVQLLSSTPVHRYSDHTSDVVNFSWSHTNFLLSASLDKTVRLWHPSRSGCLHIFRHADFVTSVDFHPFDDAYFLSGGFDKKLRVWSIPDGRVKDWAQAPDIITSASYAPGARFIVAGLFHGQVIFYSNEGLKYYTQIASKNRRGGDKRGKKVTGLSFLSYVSDEKLNLSIPGATIKDNVLGQGVRLETSKSQYVLRAMSPLGKSSHRQKQRLKDQMLVTTNDSRLRLFGLNDYCMVRKYKGVCNSSMQIRARFSESGEFIVCGSENGIVHIWNTATKRNPLKVHVGGTHNYDKVKSQECFEASKAGPPIVTDTVFVPSRAMKRSFLSSGLFPTLPDLDHITHDMSSAAIVTADYEGTVRVFLRKHSLDTVIRAAGPEGAHSSPRRSSSADFGTLDFSPKNTQSTPTSTQSAPTSLSSNPTRGTFNPRDQ